MSKDSVVEFTAQNGVNDPLTALLWQGAKALIQRAIEAELSYTSARLLVGFGILPLSGVPKENIIRDYNKRLREPIRA